MKILVLNCGSSSIKYKLFEMADRSVIAQGGVEKIGLKDSFLKFTKPNGEKKVIEKEMPEHTVGVELILNTLTSAEDGVLKSLNELDAVGHRVLHGGQAFSESVLINDEVIKAIEDNIELGPLHNPANLKGINAVKKILPNIPQVAVFDTAFHQTMPEKAFMYALPYEYYEKFKVRRYGFHGTSHRYVSKRVCDFLGIKPEGTKIITAHVGNGGSLAAIKDGKCVDTTMGMTPAEGLMMGTRAGEVDPGMLPYVFSKGGLNADSFNDLVNKKSGLLGVSGVSSDMRDIMQAIADGNERAKLALDMFVYRLTKLIGSFVAAMNGTDILVFTGGIGENSDIVRRLVCDGLTYLGLKIDEEKNSQAHGTEVVISTADSKMKVVVIPTDEELTIASDTEAIVKK
ncbi:MAG: acetate kinase [Paludibacteraceae bacterium]|jgi:acetate kinase|nr:acetate kinase [Bacteroidales bacterium]MBO7337491.1 acetate kinase [Paludibacteraceae bacterium]MBP3467118.1 acetate kinase [Paludibacteraceae bacterium]MBQ1835664.1 acetate kinase [Paludibacteraceae bacterium]MBQ2051847.1 acetate kinase [Paludibacteraceae bacterium]